MWKDFFDFTYTERIAVRVLLVLILASLGLKYYLNHQPAIPPEDYSRANQLLLAFQDSLEQLQNEFNLLKENANYKSKYPPFREINPLDESTDSSFKASNDSYSYQKKSSWKKDETPTDFSSIEKVEIQPVSLNQCTDSDLIHLPCIGPVLAKRIIAFRDRLGGYYSPAQMLEVYGLPADCYPSIAPWVHATDQEVRKLSLNFASREELASHPYLGKLFADKIIRYRKEKGFITPLDKLQQDSILPDSVYQKIQYYLSLE